MTIYAEDYNTDDLEAALADAQHVIDDLKEQHEQDLIEFKEALEFERERCAKLAASYLKWKRTRWFGRRTPGVVAKEIAERIRRSR